MSIVSSATRVSRLSSILKGSSVRSSFGQPKKICFKLPEDIKSVLTNYENGSDRQEYHDMICILRDTNVKDQDLLELINDLQKCISMLGPTHKLLIEVLFNVNWTDRPSEITKAFKKFVEDLMCLHIYHSKLIFDKLVYQFRSVNEGATQWENGKCPDEHKMKISHVHDLLKKFIKIIPMSCEVLIQSLTSLYPHVSEGTLVTERYLFALLQVIEYAPHLQREILFLIINKLTALDVTLPPSEIQYYEEDMEEDIEDGAIFELDESINKENKNSNKEMRHPSAQMLDVCMDQLLFYIHESCHEEGVLQMNLLKRIYNDLIHIFEKVILPTHASHHIQFVMFYLCSFKPTVTETFIKWLWQKVTNPNIAPVIRQTSVSYISSLLARANFVSVGLIQDVLSEMSTWIHSYISYQDNAEARNSDVRVHSVFYSVCQGMFYLLAFRHKDIIVDKKNLLFLQALNLNKIITCRLNPLKYCQTAVVQNFAAVTRNYQLAYCYTVIERNSRYNLPVISHSTTYNLDTFFPFDPYLLNCSGEKITPLYNQNQCKISNTDNQSNGKSECDENDFMDDSFLNMDSQSNIDKFSYSTSPGFMMQT